MRRDQKKIELTIKLIQAGRTYREIHEHLTQEFGSSISNSTIKKVHQELKEQMSKDKKIARLEKEVDIFKKLYFEVLEKLEENP